jgi:glutaminyl-tRNA synthetase
MCVLRPLKVTISNWPAGHTEQLAVPKHPKDEAMGERQLVMSKEVFIDQHDFAEQPEGKWKRLAPEQSVRLRGGYVITCEQVIKDATDDVVGLVCRYDENTLGTKPEGYKPNGVVHWVSAEAHQVVNVRLYDRLFNHANPDGDKEVDFMTHVNPNNLLLIEGALAEPSLASAQDGDRFQFEREGYFCVDKDSTSQRLVFNRTVTLRDSWAKKG